MDTCESIFTTAVILSSMTRPFIVIVGFILLSPLIWPFVDNNNLPEIVVEPTTFTLPLISSFADGLVVPIPRFPFWSNLAASIPVIRNGIIFCEGSRLLTSISFDNRI